MVTGSDTELPPDQENIQTEDQSYRETVRGVKSHMRWDFIPDLESLSGTGLGHESSQVRTRPETDSHGQHHCGLLYKQGGWYEVRIPLCSVMEAPLVVQPQEHHSSGATYSGSPKRDCRQAVSSQSGDPDRVVSSPGVQPPLPTVALSQGGPVYNQIQQQTLRFGPLML